MIPIDKLYTDYFKGDPEQIKEYVRCVEGVLDKVIHSPIPEALSQILPDTIQLACLAEALSGYAII